MASSGETQRGPLPDNPKLFTREELAARLDALRQDSRIVFTNGCFDLLHPGHVDLLSRCRAQGDLLVLGLNSDASVRRLKGPTRPVVDELSRAYVLAGLACVDFVCVFSEDTPLALITALRPHVLVKGGDWPVENIVGRDVVEGGGGRVLSLPLLPGYSTTAIIQAVLAARG